ncbi:BhlA/UviB family holin-like peptide [Paenibacillus sp. 1P03SA]|uniref:BhlA/UviB family holin-like peptide n=1 Tax=Paenibacillus sp. 1P03SA TaxID=3132294 RepID=UPI00399FF89B
MDQTIIDAALKDGLWAVLFVSLFLYNLKESKTRENKLMNFIDEISKQFEALAKQYERLSEDVRTIKDDIKSRREQNRKEDL